MGVFQQQVVREFTCQSDGVRVQVASQNVGEAAVGLNRARDRRRNLVGSQQPVTNHHVQQHAVFMRQKQAADGRQGVFHGLFAGVNAIGHDFRAQRQLQHVDGRAQHEVGVA